MFSGGGFGVTWQWQGLRGRVVVVCDVAMVRAQALSVSSPFAGHADEQAPRLAPEKRDFTATYTLGATMRQITYY